VNLRSRHGPPSGPSNPIAFASAPAQPGVASAFVSRYGDVGELTRGGGVTRDVVPEPATFALAGLGVLAVADIAAHRLRA
jgi:hypothetical protein